jgi:hypothetical protein
LIFVAPSVKLEFLRSKLIKRGSLTMDREQHRTDTERNKVDGQQSKIDGRIGNMGGGQNKEEWMKLCEQAAVEKDPEKLLALTREINRLLRDREDGLKKPAQRP